MLMISCGGGGSDSTEIFDTVSLTASYEGDVYTADAVVWTDTDDDGICDSATVFNDDVTVNIKSDQKQNSNNAFPVIITSYTVTFTPLENSPDVATKTFPQSWKINPGSSVDVPVRVIDQEDKGSKSSPLYYGNLGGDVYDYTMTVRLTGKEQFSGESNIIQVQFPLQYMDVADDCN
jgi:hypothetical protein